MRQRILITLKNNRRKLTPQELEVVKQSIHTYIHEKFPEFFLTYYTIDLDGVEVELPPILKSLKVNTLH